jgi:N-acetylglucosamine kinase-like BadF-type ATPase
MSANRWYLGIDGGQTSTVALIADQTGAVVGVGHSGPCTYGSGQEGREKYKDTLGEAVWDAALAAGVANGTLERVPFEAACLGLSGGAAGKEEPSRETITADRYVFTHDADIALTGALAGEPGVIVIAGTGSIAYGKNMEGKSARAGGWGFLFGDEGGAFDLVRHALRAVLRHEEGWGSATQLRDALLQATGAVNANDLVHRFYTSEFPRPRIASLAPLVDQSARDGDQVARDILHGAAQALALYAAAVRRQLFDDFTLARVSYVGGVFDSHLLLERFRTLVELESSNRVTPPVYGPASGALIEAFRAAGLNVMPSGSSTDL